MTYRKALYIDLSSDKDSEREEATVFNSEKNRLSGKEPNKTQNKYRMVIWAKGNEF